MNFKERIAEYLNYKKLGVLLALGIILMMLGRGGGEAGDEAVSTGQQALDEKKLCEILESVEGAGDVKVFISYSDGGYEIPLYDMQSSSGENEYDLSIKADANSPYIVRRMSPEIRGVLVTASGAGNTSVKMRLKESVRCATGVPPGRIHIECSER